MYIENIRYSATAFGASPRREILKPGEVNVRHFKPESLQDLADLHDIDLDTRNSTVDVTGAEDAISPEDLREWMKDPALYAIENRNGVFAEVWFTEDANVTGSRKARRLLADAGYEGTSVKEFNNGELKGAHEHDILKGWKKALRQYAADLGEKSRGIIITAYTTDAAEADRYTKAGFEFVGTTSRYYAGMDNGLVDITRKPHYVYALDLELATQKKSAWMESRLGSRNRAAHTG